MFEALTILEAGRLQSAMFNAYKTVARTYDSSQGRAEVLAELDDTYSELWVITHDGWEHIY